MRFHVVAEYTPPVLHKNCAVGDEVLWTINDRTIRGKIVSIENSLYTIRSETSQIIVDIDKNITY